MGTPNTSFHRRSTAVLKLNIEEVNDVNEIPSRSAANTENENNDIAVELNGKRKNGHLQPNIRITKRQRATQSKKGRIIELDLARDSTVLDLKKRVCLNSEVCEKDLYTI